MKRNIAIIVVAYNRIDSIRRLLNSLLSADYGGTSVSLIISVDKSNTDLVEKYADNFEWKYGSKIVDKHNENLGLRAHMLSLGKWFSSFDALVVLEDDIVVAQNFFNYTKVTVDKYYKNENIAGISLYSYRVNYQDNSIFIPIKDAHDAYFMNCAMSWGQIWLKEQWQEFYKWYLENKDTPFSFNLPTKIRNWGQKSWLKYHIRYCIETNKYFVFPYTSLSTNFADLGTHNSQETSVFQVPLMKGIKKDYYLPDVNSSAVYYDGFYENKNLPQFLGYDDASICIDLYGLKHNHENKRYWLTTKIFDYNIVKSFAICFRPIEDNIFLDLAGNDIYLYDTSIFERNKNKRSTKIECHNLNVSSVIWTIRRFGLFNSLNEVIKFLYKVIKSHVYH